MLLGEELTPESYVIVDERILGKPLTRDWLGERWAGILEKLRLATRVKTNNYRLFHFDTLRKYFAKCCERSGVDSFVAKELIGLGDGACVVYFSTEGRDYRSPELVRLVGI